MKSFDLKELLTSKAILTVKTTKSCMFSCILYVPVKEVFLLTGDRRQARHFYLAKQFCFLDADCLVVGESQGSSRRSVGKYPVKPPRPEGDSQTIGTYRCRNH